jgi:hypothetical protein
MPSKFFPRQTLIVGSFSRSGRDDDHGPTGFLIKNDYTSLLVPPSCVIGA